MMMMMMRKVREGGEGGGRGGVTVRRRHSFHPEAIVSVSAPFRQPQVSVRAVGGAARKLKLNTVETTARLAVTGRY